MPEYLSNISGQSLKSREIRLGLVMYGGVSLAIYINGVAREFFRAVRGEGVYKWLKALTDSDIVVDIISGTSAGGINGIMLGYALCNGKDFAAAAELWRRDGDIRSLLRTPNGDGDGVVSLLDSEGYYQTRLEEAFRRMPDCTPRIVADEAFNTSVQELDLFVTGTDVDGNISTVFDDAGHPIDVKDHRSVFLLKHRKGRKEPFTPSPVTFQALAKLARITSCFPAAFAPVQVTNPKDTDGDSADALLQTWGKLNKEATFLDGGVIDNKPFTYTLRQIFGRAATRQIERKVFYVDPDPERFQQPTHASQPNFVQAILASLIGIPGYESISEDLKLVTQRNRKLLKYRRLLKGVERQYDRFKELLQALRNEHGNHLHAEALLRQHREMHQQCRMILISERAVRGILREEGHGVLLSDPEMRRIGASLFMEFDQLQEEAASVLEEFDVYFRLRRLYRMVYLIVDLLHGSNRPQPTKPERRALEQLWQAVNRQIELLEIVRYQMEKLLDNADFKWQQRFEKREEPCRSDIEFKVARKEAARQIWEVASRALLRIVSQDEAPGKYLKELYPVISGTELSDAEYSTRLTEFNRLLSATTQETCEYVALGKFDTSQAQPPPKSFFAVTDKYECQLLDLVLNPILPVRSSSDYDSSSSDPTANRPLAREVRLAYKDYDALDSMLLPIELMGDLHEKDTIETIRISPADATLGFSDQGLSDKVAGDALYHFASFFKRSWRSNDILWGRLDGLCQIVESLLAPERVRELLSSEEGTKRFRRFFFDCSGEWNSGVKPKWKEGMSPLQLFPNAGQRTQQELEQWVEEVANGNHGALKDGRFSDCLKLLIEAAQLEILNEDVPKVISDALEEQALWNQFRFAPAELTPAPATPNSTVNGVADPFVWPHSENKIDRFIGAVAAAAQSYANAKHFEDDGSAPRPRATKLGKFFRQQYHVGTEEMLKDMPQLVLLEILAVALLVLRNCLLTTFGPNARRVKESPLYFFGVDLPLRAFYGAVIFLRRAPRYWVAFMAGVTIISLLLLFVGFNWRDSIIYTELPKGGFEFHLKWFAIFIGVPMTMLVGQYAFFWHGQISRWRWLRMVRFFVIGVLLTAPLLALILTAQATFNVFINFFNAASAKAVQELSGRFGLPEWIASLALQLSLPALVVSVGVAIWWLKHLKRSPAAKEEEMRIALRKHFSRDSLETLACRLFDMTPSQFEKELVQPAWQTSWVKLAKVLRGGHLPATKLEQVRQELGAQDPEKTLSWEDIHRVLLAQTYDQADRQCMFDSTDLDSLARKLGFDENLVNGLLALVKLQDRSERLVSWSKLARTLHGHLSAERLESVRKKLGVNEGDEVDWYDARDELLKLTYDSADHQAIFDEQDLVKLARKLQLGESIVDKLLHRAKHTPRNSLARLEKEMRAVNPEALR
ncbi:MAG: patatin-like protein [Acidobacteria bacterium]|nr:patatin-like protein [Acidobacteriota bacterium]